MKTIAIILAGGTGKRLGADIPKQFLKVNNKMIIEYTIEAFHNNERIDEIAIVCHANYSQYFLDSIKKNNYYKIKKILNGGNSRFLSSLAVIRAYDGEEEMKMLFHDGVRPLITNDIINRNIDRLDEYNAVGTGIETTDTIWAVEKDTIQSIPDRRKIFRAQTPQSFIFSTIKRAYDMAMLDKTLPVTDDCGVIKHYLPEEKIGIVTGDERNIKITRKEDLLLLNDILNERK